MHKYETTAGYVVEVNDNSVAKAESLGWKKVSDKPQRKPKAAKRGNRTDDN